MADYSFDIVSKVDNQEIVNAVNQATKELGHRYDLKNSDSTIEFKEKDNIIHLASQSDFTLKAVRDILYQKLIKRDVSLKSFEEETISKATGDTVRQDLKVIQGIPQDKAKTIVADIKKSKLKVQIAIQGDQIRVSAKKKDELQSVIQEVKTKNYPFFVGFTNYR